MDGAEPVATLDSPDEGLSGLKLSSVVIDQSRLAFELKVSNAKYEGKLNAAGTEATGTWSQRGASMPLSFVKKDKVTPEPKVVGKEQIWEGKLGVGAGLEIRLVVRVQKTEDGPLLGKFDSPDQGAKGLKLDSVTLDKTKLTFAMKAIGATYEGKLNPDENEAVGTFTQNGAKIPLTLKKTDKASVLRRPQTPKPPFPYKVEDLTYRNEPAGITLAGTLTIPEGRGPFPAVILISGSGAQDRDETIFQHKPFLVLADMLTRRGVAVLRVDDRGVGGSSGSIGHIDQRRLRRRRPGRDRLAQVAARNRRPQDRPDRPQRGRNHRADRRRAVAATSRSSSCWPAPGCRAARSCMMQARLIGKVMGANDKDLDKQKDMQKRSVRDHEEPRPTPRRPESPCARSSRNCWTSSRPKNARRPATSIRWPRSEVKKARVALVSLLPLLRPAADARQRCSCPVLALNGEKDLQVPPKENLEEIAKAIKKGGNARVTTKQLPGLNHLFQTCKTGSVAEYAQIEETIAPAALKVIGDWVVAQ